MMMEQLSTQETVKRGAFAFAIVGLGLWFGSWMAFKMAERAGWME